MATFITELASLTVPDMECIEKLERTDKIYLLAAADAGIPIPLYPFFASAKAKIEFMAYSDDNKDYMLFMLGILCADTGNSVSLVLRDENPIASLNGCSFENSKGSFTVNVFSDFKAAIKASSGKTTAKKTRTRTPKEPKESKESPSAKPVKNDTDELPMNPPVLTEQNGEVEEKPVKIEKKTEEKPIKASKFDVVKAASAIPAETTASPELIEALRKIETKDVPLSKIADTISDCLTNCTDAFMTLEFQVQLRIGADFVKPVCNLLNEDFMHLKALV